MSNIPLDLKYSNSHEWIRDNYDNTVTIGITHYAQDLLGDIVFVELPELSKVIKAGTEIAVIESVKAASDIYSPVNGTIIEVNKLLADFPEKVNKSPYGEGWLISVRVNNLNQFNKLMNAEIYASYLDIEK